MDDVQKAIGSWELKQEALYRTLWRTEAMDLM